MGLGQGISSFNGRVGAVVPVPTDYPFADIISWNGTAYGARPAGLPDGAVLWIGPNDPTSAGATANDTWLNTNATPGQSGASLGGNGKTGIYVPKNWGSNWLPKLKAAQAGTGFAKIGIRGDSVTYGYYTSNPLTASPAGALAAALQGANGSPADGGSGFQTPFSAFGINAHGLASAVTTSWNAAGNVGWASTGTWAFNTTQWGPANCYIDTATVNSTVTIGNLRGTTIAIYTLGNGGGTSPWTYSVDGAAAVAVTDTTAGLTVQKTVITGLSAGTHSVVITKTGTTATTLYVAGVEAYNATGIEVANFSLPGSGSTSWPVTSTPASGLWAGGSLNPVDLLIYELAVNDCAFATSTGITLTATAGAGALTLSLNGYLPAGRYFIDNEMVDVTYTTGTASPWTAHLLAGTANAHASAAVMQLPASTPEYWREYTSRALSDARAGEWGSQATGTLTGTCDLILVLPHVGRYDSLDQYYAVCGYARGLAEAYGAALVDEWALGRNSYPYYASLNYWGSSAAANTAGTDPIHRTDAGATALANALLPVVQGTLVTI